MFWISNNKPILQFPLPLKKCLSEVYFVFSICHKHNNCFNLRITYIFKVVIGYN